MKTEIRIIIAGDHPIFREGLRQVIEKDPLLKVVAEAEDGDSALGQIEEFKPEIAILDIDMPNKDGFAVARLIREQRKPVSVIFLTMHKDEMHFNDAPPDQKHRRRPGRSDSGMRRWLRGARGLSSTQTGLGF